jgi:hypothetical protein
VKIAVRSSPFPYPCPQSDLPLPGLAEKGSNLPHWVALTDPSSKVVLLRGQGKQASTDGTMASANISPKARADFPTSKAEGGFAAVFCSIRAPGAAASSGELAVPIRLNPVKDGRSNAVPPPVPLLLLLLLLLLLMEVP